MEPEHCGAQRRLQGIAKFALSGLVFFVVALVSVPTGLLFDVGSSQSQFTSVDVAAGHNSSPYPIPEHSLPQCHRRLELKLTMSEVRLR